MLSTAGHCDQSRLAMIYAPSLRIPLREFVIELPRLTRPTGSLEAASAYSTAPVL
jgi:hypothetical protein